MVSTFPKQRRKLTLILKFHSMNILQKRLKKHQESTTYKHQKMTTRKAISKVISPTFYPETVNVLCSPSFWNRTEEFLSYLFMSEKNLILRGSLWTTGLDRLLETVECSPIISKSAFSHFKLDIYGLQLFTECYYYARAHRRALRNSGNFSVAFRLLVPFSSCFIAFSLHFLEECGIPQFEEKWSDVRQGAGFFLKVQ